MAEKVPRGMDFEGFFRSPDIFIPDIIPVTAGKNTAKTTQKSSELRSAAPHISMVVSSMGPPKNRDSKDSTIPNMMKYWARIATLADMVAKVATPTVVTRPTVIKSREGNTLVTLSAKPTVYLSLIHISEPTRRT